MIVVAVYIREGSVVTLSPTGTFVSSTCDARELVRKLSIFARVLLVCVDSTPDNNLYRSSSMCSEPDVATDNQASVTLMEELLAKYSCMVEPRLAADARIQKWMDKAATYIVVQHQRLQALDDFGLPRSRIVARIDREDEAVQAAVAVSRGGPIAVPCSFTADADMMLDVAQKARDALGKGQALMLWAAETVTPPSAEVVAKCDGMDIDVVLTAQHFSVLDGPLDGGTMLGALCRTDRPDGLYATVVCDEMGVALGLVYSSLDSIRAAVSEERGVYYSRSRGGLWYKGETSGAKQLLKRIELDCDRDALQFIVKQESSGFCHLNTRKCWGEDDSGLGGLQRVLESRRDQAPAGSYTKRLFDDPSLLAKKIREEADELIDAKSSDETVWEAADLLYFSMVALARAGVSIVDVQEHLDRRSLKVTRRPGNAKPAYADTPTMQADAAK